MVFLDYALATSTSTTGTLFTAPYKCMVSMRLVAMSISAGAYASVKNNSTNETAYIAIDDSGIDRSSQTTFVMNSGETLVTDGAFSALSIEFHYFRLPEAV